MTYVNLIVSKLLKELNGPREDKLVWVGNKSGHFSVKSSYLFGKQDSFHLGAGPVWKTIWKAPLHERLKMFLWRLCSKVIPTRQLLFDRIGHGERSCFFVETR